MRAYLVLVVVTAVACGALTPLMRRLGLRARVFTPLRQRDVHRHPVPKLGGVAMAAAVLVGFAAGGVVPFLQGIYADDAAMRGLLVAIAVVLVVGIADDMWDLRWWVKMAGQVLAGLAVALGGIRIEAMPVGWIPVGNETTQVFLTVFAVVLTMNAINFVDGLDGLAAGVALIGGSAFFVYSYLLTRTINQFDYANLATLLMALLVGACVGFLPWNLAPARIFMGEVGAMLIGLLMAAAAVAVTADVNALDGMRFRNVPAYMPILLPVAVLALPLADLALAVLRRTAKGASPFSADRGHLHHKLVDGGYTQAQAVGLLWLWAFLVAWGAVSLNFVGHMVVLPVLAVALAGAGYLTLHPIVERRRADRNDAAAHPDERGTRDRGGRSPTPAPLGEPPRLVGDPRVVPGRGGGCPGDHVRRVAALRRRGGSRERPAGRWRGACALGAHRGDDGTRLGPGARGGAAGQRGAVRAQDRGVRVAAGGPAPPRLGPGGRGGDRRPRDDPRLAGRGGPRLRPDPPRDLRRLTRPRGEDTEPRAMPWAPSAVRSTGHRLVSLAANTSTAPICRHPCLASHRYPRNVAAPACGPGTRLRSRRLHHFGEEPRADPRAGQRIIRAPHHL